MNFPWDAIGAIAGIAGLFRWNTAFLASYQFNIHRLKEQLNL
jgi:hypothetical protein